MAKFAPWQFEWAKFTEDSVERIKSYSDDTHLEREWMCYVYEQDFGIMTDGGSLPRLYSDENGKEMIFGSSEKAQAYMAERGISGTVTSVYQLGNVSYGDESRIEVNPTAKETQDGAVRGLEKKNRKWTIHGHPLKDGKIYTGRQYFSSTDVLDEYVRVRDTNEPAVQFVVFPHQQTDTNTGKKVIHNRCRILIFPDANTIMQAMAESSPGCNPKTITRENGFNQNAADGSLKNEAGADWFAFQEALGKKGYMGIVDIEGKKSGADNADGGSTHLDTESNKGLAGDGRFAAEGVVRRIMKPLPLLLIAAGVVLMGKDYLQGRSIFMEDDNMEAESHWWQS